MDMQNFPVELGLTELIGADEQVAQNQWGASVACTVGAVAAAGYIEAVVLYSTGGDVLQPTGKLVFFDANPAIAVGDANITAAETTTIIASVDAASGDWIKEAGGTAVGTWTINLLTDPIPFHHVTTLYVALHSTLATTINSAAGDDEVISFNMWYRKAS